MDVIIVEDIFENEKSFYVKDVFEGDFEDEEIVDEVEDYFESDEIVNVEDYFEYFMIVELDEDEKYLGNCKIEIFIGI